MSAMVADRVALARALSPARPGLVAALTAVLAIGSAIPAATAVTLAFVVDRLGDGLLGAALVSLAFFATVLLAGHAVEAAAGPLEFLARARIDGAHRTELARLVLADSTIGHLEDPETQGLIRLARADPEHGPNSTPADGALAQLRLAAGLLGAAASAAVLAGFAWWLPVLVVAPAGLGWYLRSRQYTAAVRAWDFATRQELFADVWRQATVSPSEGKDIRIYGFADWMVRRMQHHIAHANAPLWTSIVRMARGEWVRFLLVAAGLVPAYLLVTSAAVSGATTVAVQTAVLAAAFSLCQVLGGSDDLYQMAGAVTVLGASRRLRQALRAEPGAPPDAATPRADGPPPAVHCEQLTFRYPGTERMILDGVDLEIRPGELLAIVGLNGAGKSTLIKLLAGLYEPTSGRVTVDGRDLAGLDARAWRSQLAVVFQDFVHYQLSAADNVHLGHAATPPDRAAIVAAGRDAGFDAVVGRLPAGWDTPLARSRTGGVDLSGGQWQQVALARARYAARRGARILVLDEPTAHLDVRTEFDVFARLAEYRGDTSVVLISHRLSTVRRADRIVVLDGGRITESGTHDDLIALGGSYAELFAIQAERFSGGYDDRLEYPRRRGKDYVGLEEG